MRYVVPVRGRGRVQIAASGVANAEYVVEKELRQLWPEAHVRIDGISRVGPSRIVEEFDVAYTIEGSVEAEAARPEEAPSAAFRQLRTRLEGSRYGRTSWERIVRHAPEDAAAGEGSDPTAGA